MPEHVAPFGENDVDILNNSRLRKIIIAVVLVCACSGAALMNSFRFDPDPSSDADFIARAQQKSAPGIRVSASALGARESLAQLRREPRQI